MTSPDAATDAPLPFNLTDLDLKILNQADEEYTPHSWKDLQSIIASDDLHLLTRRPSQLRAYLAWTTDIKAKYGSMLEYIFQERLHWRSTDSTVRPSNLTPFVNARDYKILLNDWPYGCEKGIWHLLVWMKTRLPVSPEDGRLTEEGRDLVEDFVERAFRRSAEEEVEEGKKGDKVLWFKNWTALQSMAGVEHFHVLVRDVDEETIEWWTREKIGKMEEA